MKRSGFAPKWTPRPPREWTGALPRARAVVQALFAPRPATVAMPKENVIQSEAYMAAVRKLPCARCMTIAVPRVFCHADLGKGTSIKTDCRRGWPGCPACHYFVGSTGHMSKSGRREFERFAGACTRAEIIARGEWPKKLPRWEGA